MYIATKLARLALSVVGVVGLVAVGIAEEIEARHRRDEGRRS